MKKLKIFMLLPVVLAVSNAFAQSGPHLNLSDQYPAAGEKLTFTYDPSGTVVDGKKDITSVVYYLDNKNYPAYDVKLTQEGASFKGELSVPDSAKAFFVRISSGDDVENNDGKGYVYLIYRDKQPVEGAYAMEAYAVSSGLGNTIAKIKIDIAAGVDFYKKEFALYPQSEKGYRSNYYLMMARSPLYKPVVNQKLTGLEKSNDEKDVELAVNILRWERNNSAADSLTTIAKHKFPGGQLDKNDLAMSVMYANGMAKKDSLYKEYVKKFPENGTEKTSMLDNLNVQMAAAYLQKEDMVNYKKYEAMVKNKSMLNMTLNNTAWYWAVDGKNLEEAEKLSKQTVDMAEENENNASPSAFTSLSQAKVYNQDNFNTYADTYAFILFKENKPTEALKYMKIVYERTPNEVNSSEHYVQILGEAGHYDLALQIAEKSMRKGQSSDVLKDELKKDYIKVKGNDEGYDKYYASIESESKQNARAALAKTMINQPAPLFTLKDLDGNVVSLKDLKGKTVIVDFWATWCGPCKASFPGMQMAVSKYKDDPNVTFLFIDTRETAKNYTDGVRKFIADNKYTFHVLLDEKGDDGGQSKVLTAFEVNGIPTKFIIDKNGNIRFKHVGYDASTPEIMAEDISDMIDVASNPDSIVSSEVK